METSFTPLQQTASDTPGPLPVQRKHKVFFYIAIALLLVVVGLIALFIFNERGKVSHLSLQERNKIRPEIQALQNYSGRIFVHKISLQQLGIQRDVKEGNGLAVLKPYFPFVSEMNKP